MWAVAAAGLSAQAEAAPPHVRASASAQVVAPGETFVVTVESSEVENSADLGLETTGKAAVLRTTSGAKSFSFSFGNGGSQQSVTHSIQSYVKATGPGPLHFTPTVRVAGKLQKGLPITVQVDEIAARQRARSRDPFDDLFGNPTDPFGPGQDPFRGLRDMLPKNAPPGGLDDLLDREFGPARVPELELPAARAPYAFLHAVAPRQRLVVGESVVVRNYVYLADGYPLRHFQPRYPVAPDFELHALSTNGDIPTVGQVSIGGVRYTVKSAGSFLLVPLKVGTLEVGGASAILETLPNRSLDRSAETLRFEVVEPPKQGRPSGYRLGDVGAFSASASAAPTVVDAGGSITLEVTTTGDGNFPAPWSLPPASGVTWSTGQVSDQIAYGEDGSRKGTRVTRYLGTLSTPGDVDLGQIAWSTYDVSKGSYVETPIVLGHVQVKRASNAVSASEPARFGAPVAPESRFVPYAAPSVAFAGRALPYALALPFLGLLIGWIRALRGRPRTPRTTTITEAARALVRCAPTQSPSDVFAATERLLRRIEQEQGALPPELVEARAAAQQGRYGGSSGDVEALAKAAVASLRAWVEARP